MYPGTPHAPELTRGQRAVRASAWLAALIKLLSGAYLVGVGAGLIGLLLATALPAQPQRSGGGGSISASS